MTTSEHLQFLALMIPTVVLLVLAAFSLADPETDIIAYQPAIQVQGTQAAVDGAGYETAY